MLLKLMKSVLFIQNYGDIGGPFILMSTICRTKIYLFIYYAKSAVLNYYRKRQREVRILPVMVKLKLSSGLYKWSLLGIEPHEH